MFIFLDESGDLGFNFEQKKSSRWFSISLLVCKNYNTIKLFKKAVKTTLHHKINHKAKQNNFTYELKGTKTTIGTKKYFLAQLNKTIDWKIYTILLNKKELITKTKRMPEAHKTYNTLSRIILEQINFANTTTVNVVVDKYKQGKEIKIFNNYLHKFLDPIIPLNTKLIINHQASQTSPGLQIIDIFAWGVFKKYENKDCTWYNMFKNKIVYEKNYQPSFIDKNKKDGS